MFNFPFFFFFLFCPLSFYFFSLFSFFYCFALLSSFFLFFFFFTHFISFFFPFSVLLSLILLSVVAPSLVIFIFVISFIIFFYSSSISLLPYFLHFLFPPPCNSPGRGGDHSRSRIHGKQRIKRGRNRKPQLRIRSQILVIRFHLGHSHRHVLLRILLQLRPIPHLQELRHKVVLIQDFDDHFSGG